MSEPQLERSVLEAKEREELFAIANALGTRPTSRARKSELVTQILQATGVEVPGPDADADRPRRATRTRRPAADVAPSAGRAEAAPAAAGQLPLEEESREAPEPRSPIRPTAPATDAPPAAPASAPLASARPVPPAPSSARTPGAALGRRPAEAPANGDRAPLPPSQSSPSSPSSASSPGTAPRAPASGTANGYGSHEAPAAQAPTVSSTSMRGNANGANGISGPELDGPPGGDNRFDGDPGNRRSRRRRGRDRPDRVERELPGQTSDQPFSGDPVPVTGVLDLRDEGYGFLRTTGSLPGPTDVYVSISQVRRFALRRGDQIEGASRPAGGNEKYPALVRVDRVGGLSPDDARGRPRFETLTPVFPDTRLRLETSDGSGDSNVVTGRLVDLVAPIGRGQRALVVSPPRAGKTALLTRLARAVEASDPEVHVLVLLVDERPEEVTEVRRSVGGEVVASTFDRPPEEHTQVAELTLERAKRMVETGGDVVIILDGLTRLARAYNLAAPPGGRLVGGGMDAGALYAVKRLFGAARNIEGAGSLTILATASVDTGSKMDEVIFEELKDAANAELRLDRRLAERGIFPAIDLARSFTRHEDQLRPDVPALQALREAATKDPAAVLERLLERVAATKTNAELLASDFTAGA